MEKLLSNSVSLQGGSVSRIKEKDLVARTTDYAAVYFEGEFGGYILGKLGGLAIRSPFFKRIIGYLGSKVENYIVKGFEDLAKYRSKNGFPEAGTALDDATVAKLRINEGEYFGVNGKYQNPKSQVNLRVNAQTKTHAEADVVQKAINDGQKGKSKIAEMWTDRDACVACGEKNGIGSLARELGVEEIKVYSPSFPNGKSYFPPKSK